MTLVKKNSFIALLFVFGCLLLLAPQQYALSKQEVSVLTDFHSDAPAPGVEPTHFVVKELRLEGNRLLQSAELTAVMGDFLNIELSYQHLLEIKAALERHYARQNLAAVVLIPPQDLSGGVLKIELVESELTDRELSRALAHVKSSTAQVR